MTTYLFIDTNVLLHFRRPDEIDWPALLRSGEIEIVLAPTVVRELDEQKARNPSRRLRRRAADVLKWLEGLLEAEGVAQLREGVGLSFVMHDPQLEFGSRQLRKEIADDWLIATALEFQDTHEGAAVVVVTDDLGMSLKAKGHGLASKKPPGEARLPEEVDGAAAEASKLKAELAALRSRQPQLVVAPLEDAPYLKALLPEVHLVSEADIQSALRYAELEAQSARPLFFGVDDDSAGLGYTREDALSHVIHTVNAKHDFMNQLRTARDQRSRTVTIELLLKNTGSATATDVDVRLEVVGVDATLSKSLIPDPVDPEDPSAQGHVPPKPGGEHLLQDDRALLPALQGCVATYHLDRLKHFDSVKLAPLHVTFRSRDLARPFSVGATTTYAEGPQKITGRIDVIIG